MMIRATSVPEMAERGGQQQTGLRVLRLRVTMKP
jgi:hypothetical protein